jgi:hypothetical protein
MRNGFCLRSLFWLICMVLFAPLAWGACGGISGTVTDSTPSPIFGVNARVFYADNRVEVASTTTDFMAGAYSVSGLPSGNYRVMFEYSPFYPMSYLSEWYNNKTGFDAAGNVPVIANVTTANIDAALADGGSLSGTVTDGNGAGIFGVQVNVFKNDSSHTNVGSAMTIDDGTYSVKGLPTGSYKVSFDRSFDVCGTVWYDGQTSFSSATAVPVTVPNDTQDVNASFPGGSIDGTVKDADTHLALPDVHITVYDAVTGIFSPYYYGFTDDSGYYKVEGLPPGSYKLSFSETSTEEYISVWYNGAFSKSTATSVNVTDGHNVTVNQDLHKGVTITGHVTNGSAANLPGIIVYAYESSLGETGDNPGVNATTDASGLYTLKGLRSGVAYKIYYHDKYNGDGYLAEWYNDKSSIATANSVTAPAANINALLTLGGKITGRLLGPCDPLDNVMVVAADLSNNAVTSTSSLADGTFTLKWLPSGTYTVTMGRGSFYALTNRSATVTLPSTTTIPDVTMSMGGSIYGRITDASGWGVASAAVGVYDGSDNILATGYTDANGYYVVGGLPTGSYRVKVTYNGCDSFTQWYNDQALVAVTAPAGTSGINISSGGTPTTGNVKMGSSFYQSIWEAYDLAGEGATILARNQDFDETPLNLNQGISVSLKGGYDSDFLNSIGVSTILGPFTISSGKVTIKDFAIR